MATDNISSMESSPPSSSALDHELASLIRVRNRLAKSSDSSLPKILTGLLPRLLLRLEDSSYQQEVVSSNPLRAQIRGHLVGILTHALERIRGNADMPIPWLPSILVSLQSDSQVVRTMNLSFVQAAMPKCNNTSILAEALVRALDRSHQRFFRDELSEGGRMEWRTTSWLLLDVIAVMSGLTPMIDWDLDCDSEYGRLGVYEPPQGALATAPLVSPGSIQAMNEDGSGVWNFLLDVLLFRSETQNARVPHHDEQEVVNGSVSVEGRGRMAFRVKERSLNAMTYLQYFKAACFRFAVSKEHPCLFQGEEGSVGASRALMLSVLLMNSSKAGKLAADYVNIHFAQMNGGFAAKKELGCSLSMACSMLLLVLGDAASAPITDQHWNQKNLWIALLGPRPSESTAMRPPLPPPISARVIEFISKNLLLRCDEGQDAVRLLVDLAVAVQKNHSENGVWAISLMFVLYKQLLMTDDNHWTNEFCEKCLTCAQDTLSALSAESTMTSRAQFEGDGVAERNWRQARARTEAELFERHRSALRKKRLRNDDATKARKSAYEVIISLGSYAAKVTRSEQGKNQISFDLAIVLFKCALIEDTVMKPRVLEALGNLLAVYKSLGEVLKESCTLHQVAFLIPSLVDSACCESEAVRLVSAQWTVELLVLVDPAAANCLCCFLADDVSFRVARLAKSIVQDAEFRQLPELHVTQHAIYEFLDLSTERDLDTLTMEVNLRISSIARDLDIPSSAASVLLLSFDGSPKAAVDACSNNREGVFQKCGIKATCDAAGRPPAESSETGETFVCGICYEYEITSANSYAMPCGHRFCVDCWESFLETKFEERPTQILNATCPCHVCTERITGVEVHEIIPRQVSKWRECLLRQFVNQERHHRFCSGPDCDVVIVAIGRTGCVTCNKCDTPLCFGCGESPHIPAQCNDFEKWKAIFGSSQFWVAKHAKPCPGCSVPIEKNQGCNHMQCSRCNTGFCWLCLGRLDGHRAHTCNRYDPAEHAEDDDEKMTLFFTDRFQAHEGAEEFARRRVEGIENKVQHLLDKNWLLFEEDALERVKAEETLVECRHFLKNSYVAAYGMKDDQSRREVFECHQGALELLTETLSGLTELSLDTVYLDRGENALHLHLRAISFYTSIVSKYMERIVNLDY